MTRASDDTEQINTDPTLSSPPAVPGGHRHTRAQAAGRCRIQGASGRAPAHPAGETHGETPELQVECKDKCYFSFQGKQLGSDSLDRRGWPTSDAPWSNQGAQITCCQQQALGDQKWECRFLLSVESDPPKSCLFLPLLSREPHITMVVSLGNLWRAGQSCAPRPRHFCRNACRCQGGGCHLHTGFAPQRPLLPSLGLLTPPRPQSPPLPACPLLSGCRSQAEFSGPPQLPAQLPRDGPWCGPTKAVRGCVGPPHLRRLPQYM